MKTRIRDFIRGFGFLLCLAVLIVTAGCGNPDGADARRTNNQKGVAEVLQAGMAEAYGESGAGAFSAFHDAGTGNDYFACVIQDATACCAQGIEFVLTEEYAYPDDYPKEGKQITVMGVFDTYMEGDYR